MTNNMGMLTGSCGVEFQFRAGTGNFISGEFSPPVRVNVTEADLMKEDWYV